MYARGFIKLASEDEKNKKKHRFLQRAAGLHVIIVANAHSGRHIYYILTIELLDLLAKHVVRCSMHVGRISDGPDANAKNEAIPVPMSAVTSISAQCIVSFRHVTGKSVICIRGIE